jgi:DNA-binding IclR family transcriptional regulator
LLKQRGLVALVSSLKRMLSVLGAFSPSEPVLGVDAIMDRFALSRGTAYRYLRELSGAGLLAHMNGGFALGPRIIELDYAIRQCDPALQAGQPIMRELCEQFDCDVLLVNFFDDRVIVSHHERGDDRLAMSYGRGRQMPLFQGCGSKMTLASLPRPRLRRLYNAQTDSVAAAGLGKTWNEFRGALDAIRRTGHAVSHAELDPDNVGVAVPIAGAAASGSPASIVLVFTASRYAIIDKALVVRLVKVASMRICNLMESRQSTADNIVWLPDRRPA